MTVIQKSALVKFSAQQMFDLVNNIEDYPKFLPWCSGSRIIKREDRCPVTCHQLCTDDKRRETRVRSEQSDVTTNERLGDIEQPRVAHQA